MAVAVEVFRLRYTGRQVSASGIAPDPLLPVVNVSYRDAGNTMTVVEHHWKTYSLPERAGQYARMIDTGDVFGVVTTMNQEICA